MNNNEVQVLLEKAIQILFQTDSWLLINNLNEQSISHKLAEHLQKLFTEYNVDCEYNGNIEVQDNRKRINLLKEELQDLGLLKSKEESDVEKEYTSRAVFPDIIIHKRGTNKDNLCIIEVKKSKSTVSYDYDMTKLRYYTSSYFGNNLEYQLGAFIVFITGQENVDYKIGYFKNGQQL
jgi:hypothetical protein